ncbi:MAG: hypothetical protein J1F13_03755 [Prevotellaceae bacterium]|nr:hypothetical protein [Prevotellaceae bacterium]
MKKFLLSMLLVMIGAMWSSVDARWNVGGRKAADQIKAGDTVVIEMASRTADLGTYIQATNGSLGVEVRSGLGVGSAAVIVLE